VADAVTVDQGAATGLIPPEVHECRAAYIFFRKIICGIGDKGNVRRKAGIHLIHRREHENP
jgi:hypothetical protein